VRTHPVLLTALLPLHFPHLSTPSAAVEQTTCGWASCVMLQCDSVPLGCQLYMPSLSSLLSLLSQSVSAVYRHYLHSTVFSPLWHIQKTIEYLESLSSLDSCLYR